jgi:hypothetical protein
MGRVIRAIPHKNFIKVLFLSGIPLKSTENVPGIDDVLVGYDFNSLAAAGDTYSKILEECEKIPGGKEMITENRIAMEHNAQCYNNDEGKEIIVVNSVCDHFRSPKIFYDLVKRNGILPWKRACTYSFRISRMLTSEKTRKFIECGVIVNMTLMDIIRGLREIYKGRYAISNVHVYGYVYYFWNLSISAMRKGGIKIEDILEYLELDPQNSFYDIHNEMIFKGVDSLKLHFGVQSEEERRVDNNARRSLTTKHIDRALNNKYIKSVPQYVIDIYRHTDSQLAEAGKEDEDKETLRKEIDAIFSKITRAKAIRKRMDELKEIPDDPKLKEKLYPKDEPYSIKK